MPRRDINDAIERRVPGTWPLRMLARAADDPLTAGGMLVVVLASATIVSNALLLQSGRHPAPLFETRPHASGSSSHVAAGGGTLISAPSSLVRDIQGSLAEKGIYRGPIDGLAGRMTTEAIVAFERAAGLTTTGEPTPQLLARLQMTADPRSAGNRTMPIPLSKPSGTSANADKRIAQIQTALNNLGYGPLEVDGLMGAATARAIRRFEVNRGLPVTGEVGDRVVAELIAIGGLPRL